MERKQFTFYESFFRAISRIKNKSARCDAYDALCEYALYGKEPDIDRMPDASAIAFELSKPNLDASRRKAQSGSKGGSSKQDGNKPQAKGKQTVSEKEKEIEKEIEIEKEDECLKKSDFEIFWQAYPRKEGKKKAQDAFAKVTVPLETLLSAVEKQKKTSQWEKDSGQYIPHPATWLEEERWEDIPVDQSKPDKRQLDEDEIEAINRMMEGKA